MFLPAFYKTKPSAQIQYASVNPSNIHEFILSEAIFSGQYPKCFENEIMTRSFKLSYCRWAPSVKQQVRGAVQVLSEQAKK